MTDLNQHPYVLSYLDWNKFGQLIGMNFTIIEPGKVSYHLLTEEKHLATPIAVHGGVIASLIDGALGVAALSVVCENKQIVSTVALNINYAQPAQVGDALTAHAHVTKSGKRILFAAAEVRNQRNELIAMGTATLNAFPFDKITQTVQ